VSDLLVIAFGSIQTNILLAPFAGTADEIRRALGRPHAGLDDSDHVAVEMIEAMQAGRLLVLDLRADQAEHLAGIASGSGVHQGYEAMGSCRRVPAVVCFILSHRERKSVDNGRTHDLIEHDVRLKSAFGLGTLGVLVPPGRFVGEAIDADGTTAERGVEERRVQQDLEIGQWLRRNHGRGQCAAIGCIGERAMHRGDVERAGIDGRAVRRAKMEP
jgi:hypothetical protein